MKNLKKTATELLSVLIRRRGEVDGYNRCVTCKAMHHWKDMDAGHAIPGRGEYVLFDEELMAVQCRTCNRIHGGELNKFQSILVQTHGQEWFDEKKRLSRIPYKRIDADYKSLIDDYKRRIKELEVVS